MHRRIRALHGGICALFVMVATRRATLYRAERRRRRCGWRIAARMGAQQRIFARSAHLSLYLARHINIIAKMASRHFGGGL
jgi:hypothetical protein